MNALTICNACEAAPMAPGQEEPGKPGYCEECLSDTDVTFEHLKTAATLQMAEWDADPKGNRYAAAEFIAVDVVPGDAATLLMVASSQPDILYRASEGASPYVALNAAMRAAIVEHLGY